MDNKPMLSVERELLERALSAVIVARGPGSPTERDLLALLDNPSECRCKRYGKDNPHWPCPVHAEPAAQHHGEPVAPVIPKRKGQSHKDWREWTQEEIGYNKALDDLARLNGW